MGKGIEGHGRRGRPELPAAAGIGSSLREARLAAGLTLAQVAGPVYSAGYLSQVERGQSSPSADAVAHFNRRLGLELTVAGGVTETVPTPRDAVVRALRLLTEAEPAAAESARDLLRAAAAMLTLIAQRLDD